MGNKLKIGPFSNTEAGTFMLKFFIPILICFVPTTGHAQTDWYILNGATNTCEEAALTALGSPEHLLSALRQAGIAPDTQIRRDPNGKIKLIAVMYPDPTSGQQTDILYFSTETRCQDDLAWAMQQGITANPNELK